MRKIRLPKHYNYIGVFLTYDCNLGCSYCINHHDTLEKSGAMSADEWVKGLSRIDVKEDLPLTLQGGEPTLHPGFYELVLNLGMKPMDMLTNGTFNVREFVTQVPPWKFQRDAKYASMRFSYHKKSCTSALLHKVFYLQNLGYEVGIWGIDHPDMYARNETMRYNCKHLNIDFRIKEFLGFHSGVLFGTYRYPHALKKKRRHVMCSPSELLISPSGHIHRCHADLYAHRHPIGHILDDTIKFPSTMECDHFGNCNPCDVKLKTDRFQEFGHSSVTILPKEKK